MHTETTASDPTVWPSLPLEAWRDTYATLHLWLQIVGKVALVRSPWINHAWHATLNVTASGLSTAPVPYLDRIFQIELDFVTHELLVKSSDGRRGGFSLRPESVATFYARLMGELTRLDLSTTIHRVPNEIADAIPFDEDESHASYDPEYANRFWRILVQADRVFNEFRARFIGKSSPVHLYWGAPDLAVSRFSGRRAPEHPGGTPNLPDWVTRESYSHEVSSCGFWPGSGAVPYPAFYAYAYPEPEGYAQAPVRPAAAFYSNEYREFILPYDAVRLAPAPDQALLDFCQTSYEAAANLAGWNRAELERERDPRPASWPRA